MHVTDRNKIYPNIIYVWNVIASNHGESSYKLPTLKDNREHTAIPRKTSPLTIMT